MQLKPLNRRMTSAQLARRERRIAKRRERFGPYVSAPKRERVRFIDRIRVGKNFRKGFIAERTANLERAFKLAGDVQARLFARRFRGSAYGRCDFQNKRKENGRWIIANPCGGKLKKSGKALVCQTCGRSYSFHVAA